MEYNKREEKLILGQPSLKLCFSYNSTHEHEHPICFILLDVIGKRGEQNQPGNLFTLIILIWKIFSTKIQLINKIASFATY